MVYSRCFPDEKAIIFWQAHVIPAGYLLYVDTKLSASLYKPAQSLFVTWRHFFFRINQHRQIIAIVATSAWFAPDHAAKTIKCGCKNILFTFFQISGGCRFH